MNANKMDEPKRDRWPNAPVTADGDLFYDLRISLELPDSRKINLRFRVTSREAMERDGNAWVITQIERGLDDCSSKLLAHLRTKGFVEPEQRPYLG